MCFFGEERLHVLKKWPFRQAAIAQLGERQTEDLKVPGSIPGLGTAFPLLTCKLVTPHHWMSLYDQWYKVMNGGHGGQSFGQPQLHGRASMIFFG